MVTKSFLFIAKSSFIIIFLSACAQLKTKQQTIKSDRPPQPTSNNQEQVVSQNITPTTIEEKSELSVGLILGPGALKMFAHIGVIEELTRARVRIDHIMGLETGALVAALYAQRAQPYDVEWQMFKLKEEDLINKALLGTSKPIEVKKLNDFLNMAFANSRIESAKVSFSCPAYNLLKQETYMMNKGPFTITLPYCLALPPLMRPYNQNIAAVMDLRGMIDHLKNRGAQYIIYVNVLPTKEGRFTSQEDLNAFWGLVNQALSKNQSGIDYIINVPLQEFDLMDFNRRRDVLQKGKEAGAKSASEIASKLGL